MVVIIYNIAPVSGVINGDIGRVRRLFIIWRNDYFSDKFAVWIKNLKSVVSGVGDIDFPWIVNIYTQRESKFAVFRTFFPKGG